MLRNIFITGFCIANITLFILIGIEVAAVTPEQAMLEGMTQRIYASISTIDYIMATLWGVILFTTLTANKEWFLRSAWLYLGFYLCDIHFGHYMGIEMGEPLWIVAPLILAAIQSAFLYWSRKHIDKLTMPIPSQKWHETQGTSL